jgi:hypothetical protein
MENVGAGELPTPRILGSGIARSQFGGIALQEVNADWFGNQWHSGQGQKQD